MITKIRAADRRSLKLCVGGRGRFCTPGNRQRRFEIFIRCAANTSGPRRSVYPSQTTHGPIGPPPDAVVLRFVYAGGGRQGRNKDDDACDGGYYYHRISRQVESIFLHISSAFRIKPFPGITRDDEGSAEETAAGRRKKRPNDEMMKYNTTLTCYHRRLRVQNGHTRTPAQTHAHPE